MTERGKLSVRFARWFFPLCMAFAFAQMFLGLKSGMPFWLQKRGMELIVK